MASTACFVIVSKNDIPIYEAEVGSAPRVTMLSSLYLLPLSSFEILESVFFRDV
jgi:hypothetical protein